MYTFEVLLRHKNDFDGHLTKRHQIWLASGQAVLWSLAQVSERVSVRDSGRLFLNRATKPQSRPEQRELQKSQHISYFIYYLERVRCINQIRNEYDITTPKSTSVSVPVGVAVPVLQLQPQLQPQDCDSVSDSN